MQHYQQGVCHKIYNDSQIENIIDYLVLWAIRSTGYEVNKWFFKTNIFALNETELWQLGQILFLHISTINEHQNPRTYSSG